MVEANGKVPEKVTKDVPEVATLGTANKSPTELEAVTVRGEVPHKVNAPVKVFGDNEDTPAAGVVDVPKTPAVR